MINPIILLLVVCINSQCSGSDESILNSRCWIRSLDTDLRTRDDAEAQCWGGANLVSIHDSQDDVFAAGFVSSTFWAGLEKVTQNPDSYTWTDGSDTTYASNTANLKQNPYRGDCYTVKKSSNQWDNHACSDLLPYLCLIHMDKFDHHCFGIRNNETNVCNGNGNCTKENTCECNFPYSGDECEANLNNVTCYGVQALNETTCTTNGYCFDEDDCRCFMGYADVDCHRGPYPLPAFETSYPAYIGACTDEFVIESNNVVGYNVFPYWSSNDPFIHAQLLNGSLIQWIFENETNTFDIDIWGEDHWGRLANTTTITIQKVGDDSVQQSLLEGGTKYNAFPASTYFTVYGTSSCDVNGGLIYKWEQVSGTSTTFETDKSIMYFPNGFPFGEATYGYEFTIVNEVYNDTYYFEISVTVRDLIVKFDTSSKDVNIDDPLVVSASNSFDPDESAESEYFFWTCLKDGTTSCTNMLTPGGGNNVTVSFTPTETSIYELECFYTKGSRTSSRVLEFNSKSISGKYIPNIWIEDPKIDPKSVVGHEKITLKGHIASHTYSNTVSFTWSSPTIDNLDKKISSNSLNELNLILKPHILRQGELNEFVLTAKYKGTSVNAKIIIDMNDPPEEGLIVTTPDIGMTGKGWFFVSFLNWEDPHKPVKYRLEYVHPIHKKKNFIHPFSAKSSFRFKAPSQGCSPDYKLPIRARIRDHYKAEKVRYFNITALPPEFQKLKGFMKETVEFVKKNRKNKYDKSTKKKIIETMATVGPDCDSLTAEELACYAYADCEKANIAKYAPELLEEFQNVTLDFVTETLIDHDENVDPGLLVDIVDKMKPSKTHANKTVHMMNKILDKFGDEIEREDMQIFMDCVGKVNEAGDGNDEEYQEKVRSVTEKVLKKYLEKTTPGETTDDLVDTPSIKVCVEKKYGKDLFQNSTGSPLDESKKTTRSVGGKINVKYNAKDIRACATTNYTVIEEYMYTTRDDEVAAYWLADGNYCNFVMDELLEVDFTDISNPSYLGSENRLTCLQLMDDGKFKKCPRKVILDVGIRCRCNKTNTRIKYEMGPMHTCWGYNATDNNACNGHGYCVDQDTCQCHGTHTGEQCNIELCFANGKVGKKYNGMCCHVLDEEINWEKGRGKCKSDFHPASDLPTFVQSQSDLDYVLNERFSSHHSMWLGATSIGQSSSDVFPQWLDNGTISFFKWRINYPRNIGDKCLRTSSVLTNNEDGKYENVDCRRSPLNLAMCCFDLNDVNLTCASNPYKNVKYFKAQTRNEDIYCDFNECNCPDELSMCNGVLHSSGSVCSGHGSCKQDNFTKDNYCECDTGFTGPDCEYVDNCEPNGYKSVIYKGKCYYYFFQEYMNWEEARRYCKNTYHNASDLAIIKSKDLWHWISRYKTSKLDEFIWIGAHDLFEDMNLRWNDNEYMNDHPTFWRKPPDDFGTGEDCVQMLNQRLCFEWNDMMCSHNYTFICQVDLNDLSLPFSNSSYLNVRYENLQEIDVKGWCDFRNVKCPDEYSKCFGIHWTSSTVCSGHGDCNLNFVSYDNECFCTGGYSGNECEISP